MVILSVPKGDIPGEAHRFPGYGGRTRDDLLPPITVIRSDTQGRLDVSTMYFRQDTSHGVHRMLYTIRRKDHLVNSTIIPCPTWTTIATKKPPSDRVRRHSVAAPQLEFQ
jgi:hypothetical protein